MRGKVLPDMYYLVSGALFTSAGWVDTLLYTFTRRTLLFNELDPHSEVKRPQMGNSRAAGFHRQGSTDTILENTGLGGIKVDKTVNIALDDMESQHSSDGDHKASVFVTAHSSNVYDGR
jgi:hypothetical protein